MVVQGATLFPWLSLRDNLEWGPRALGNPRAAAVVDELLDATGLSGYGELLPRQLSGGMRQRAAIAQVLANQPPLLLLDEPFGALDAQTRLRMQEWLIGLLAERETATVLVTHDVEEALLIGHRLRAPLPPSGHGGGGGRPRPARRPGVGPRWPTPASSSSRPPCWPGSSMPERSAGPGRATAGIAIWTSTTTPTPGSPRTSSPRPAIGAAARPTSGWWRRSPPDASTVIDLACGSGPVGRLLAAAAGRRTAGGGRRPVGRGAGPGPVGHAVGAPGPGLRHRPADRRRLPPTRSWRRWP